MGQIFAFAAAICWAALLFNLLGQFLKRFELTRKLSVVVQWQAFLLYLLGLGGTVVTIYGTIAQVGRDRDAGPMLFILLLIAVTTFVPLVACSLQFLQIFKTALMGARQGGQVSSTQAHPSARVDPP